MNKKLKRLIVWSARIFLGLFLMSVLAVIFYRHVPVYFTPLMGIRWAEQIFDKERPVRMQKKWVSLENISETMVLAVIAAEDQKFTSHKGFDWEAIEKALEGNKDGNRIKGGSTISNQTAKNVFLWPGRNWVRKGMEAYFTGLIEFFWSKERIMEVYLNVIELGDGIYGVEAAAGYFYNKSAQALSRHEAAMLAAVLPGPLLWSPSQPTVYIRGRQSWILRNMNNLGKISWEDPGKE
ncbi:MAG: monofunctional biosynthetic peptidoglycan transglycosylase [Cyclobacteriaceae bacterium]